MSLKQEEIIGEQEGKILENTATLYLTVMVYTWLLLDERAREEQKYECMRCELHEPGKYTGNNVKER